MTVAFAASGPLPIQPHTTSQTDWLSPTQWLPVLEQPTVAPMVSSLGEQLPSGQSALLDRRKAFEALLASLDAPLTVNRHQLIIGEAGMGKTALLSRLAAYLEASCSTSASTSSPIAVLRLSPQRLAEHEGQLLPVLIDAWQAFAHQCLTQALAEINAINQPMGIAWEQSDLLRALSLIKLQTEVDGLMRTAQTAGQDEFLPRQQLTNAIRSAIPKVKRLHFSAVNHAIRRLVDRLQDPWLIVASQIITPTASDVRALFTATEDALPPSPTVDSPSHETDTNTQSTHSKEQIVSQWAAAATFHQWVHAQLGTSANGERALLILDNWDDLFHPYPHLEGEWLTLLAQLKHLRLQTVLSCRAEALSRGIGGHLLAAMATPIVLPALSSQGAAQCLAAQLQHQQLLLSPEAFERLERLIHSVCQGNPLLIKMVTIAVAQQAQAETASHAENSAIPISSAKHLSPQTIGLLGLQQPSDIWELLFNRVMVAHLPHEGNVLRVVRALLDQTDGDSFEVNTLIDDLAASQQLGRLFVSSVLHSLFQQGFISELSGGESPIWQVSGRVAQTVLAEKTRWVQADVPCEEKLVYLKKIIPLSIQAGEFDAQRTQEAIALASSAGFAELKPFLETILVDATQAEHPLPQRLNALNCLATLASPACIQQLIHLVEETQPTLREYSLRNLKTLAQEHRLTQAEAEQLCQQVLPLLDAPTEALRLLAYQTLAALPLPQGSTPLVAVYLKGLADRFVPVRQLAMAQLHHADLHTALVRQALIDATQDSDPDVRREACLLLQRNPHPKAIEALLGVLEHDANPQLRSLAIRMIAAKPTDVTEATLHQALAWDLDPDVQVTLLRALRLFPSPQTETLLCQRLHLPINAKQDQNTLALQWAIAQTLGEMATQPTTLTHLENLATKTRDPFLTTTLKTAIGAIQQRQQHSWLTSSSTPRDLDHSLLVSTP